jgi:hypothetical protein
MMFGSPAVKLLFTVVFGAAALAAALPVARPRRPSGQVAAGFCIAMCAALIAMAWWAEPSGAVWLQVAAFGGTALWLVLAGPVRAGLQHALIAAAMTWMLTAIPARAPMRGMPGMTGMAAATPSVPVLAVSLLAAACCVATSIPWVTRAIGGRGQRRTDPRAASQAAMSVGMAAMLIAML